MNNIGRYAAGAGFLLGRVSFGLRVAATGLLCIVGRIIGVRATARPMTDAAARLRRLERSRAAVRLGLPVNDITDSETNPDRRFFRDFGWLLARSTAGILSGALAVLLGGTVIAILTAPWQYFSDGSGDIFPIGYVQPRIAATVAVLAIPAATVWAGWLLARTLPRWADYRAHQILEHTGPDRSLSARTGETDLDRAEPQDRAELPEVQLHEVVRRCRDATAYLLGRVVSAATYVALVLAGLLCLASCLIGIGFRLLPFLAPAIKRLGRQERSHAAQRLGLPFDDTADGDADAGEIAPLRPTLRDLALYRDIVGLTIRSAIGVLAGGLAALIIAGFVNYLTLPILYPVNGEGHQVALVGVQLRDWGRVIAVTPLGILICSWLLVRVVPGLANWDARLTLLLLGIPARVELARRVDELTDTRTEALDAHGAELRRIERDLHDGAQARLVSVTMRLGLAERQIAEDPQKAAELILSAQSSAEEALAELRDIVRGIYPPVLADRGLAGAVAALAARCAIPTTVGADDIGRAPAAVEAAAYFVVAEALTNVSKHSAAEHAVVRLRKDGQQLIVEVTDDGHGGAEETLGTGLDGIRRRAAALDGQMQLFSPLGGPTVLRVELPCGS